MKSFNQFLTEAINISGDFNGNINIGDSPSNSNEFKESFCADIVWQGRLYRLQVEGSIMNKNELAEQLQDEYPGAIVHNIYPQTGESSLRIKKSQRYQPERLSWSD